MRLAVGVEYDGSAFYGWQRQRQSPTVQACVEEALARVANHPVTVHCAGRTDTGVHAVCQVIHFDTDAERDERAWVLGANSRLHPGASLLWVRPVAADFHARFSALSRRYSYRILNRWVRPAIERGRVGWVRKPLTAALMHEAAQLLLGEHDFSSFRAAGCQSKSPMRRVDRIDVVRHGQHVHVDIEANAFVYHMVRNIVGALLAIGLGERDQDWLAEVLAARDRRQSAVTAEASGLYFMDVRYSPRFELPCGIPVSFPPGAA